ncbi:MAG: hypothetical protein IPQ07_38880 [Myxococcales bacterium]|nr:hypothetical protein [Myxococcales bacterium]
MRQQRRISFAAPFVMIVTAACGGPAKQTPIHDNPPQPQPQPQTTPTELTAEQCKAITHDSPCEGTQSCHIADGCGLNGFECRDGKWQEQMLLCNPPPPAPPSPK